MEAGPYSLIYFFGCQFGGFFFCEKVLKKILERVTVILSNTKTESLLKKI